MNLLDDSWRECPGGPGVNINLERAEADCPGCGSTFTTLASDPSFPRHFVDPDGRVVVFTPMSERGERLRELRTQLGLTKSHAARLAGVSRREWHEAEEGPQPVRVQDEEERINLIKEMLDVFKDINDA